VPGISSPFFKFGNGSFELIWVDVAVEFEDEVDVEVSGEPIDVVAVLVSEALGEVDEVGDKEGSGLTNV